MQQLVVRQHVRALVRPNHTTIIVMLDTVLLFDAEALDSLARLVAEFRALSGVDGCCIS